MLFNMLKTLFTGAKMEHLEKAKHSSSILKYIIEQVFQIYVYVV